MSVAKFILLFRNSLRILHFGFYHEDEHSRKSLSYIDGDLLFNEIMVHMKAVNDLSFCIDMTCMCSQQMDSIIRSFRTGELTLQALR